MVQVAVEQIGDAYRQYMEVWRRGINQEIQSGLGDTLVGPNRKRGWVAEIVGLDPKYRFDRRFLKGNRSYEHANGIGSRGVYDYYNLHEGRIYDIKQPTSWGRSNRYYAVIESGVIRQITADEVEQCLKNRLG